MREENKFKIKSLKDVLKEVITQKPLIKGVQNVRICNSWAEVMGENIQKYIYNVKYKRGILFIKLKSSVLKEELIFEKNKVIKLINQELGKEYVKELVLN